MAERSKALVWGCSHVGILCSNSARGIDVCLSWMLYVVRQSSVLRADHSSRGVISSVVCLSECDLETSNKVVRPWKEFKLIIRYYFFYFSVNYNFFPQRFYFSDIYNILFNMLFLLLFQNTGCFIMFSVITNIYNKKPKEPTLMELFTATGNLIFFFWQLEMFDVSTTGETAHTDTIFKLLPNTHTHTHKRKHGCFLLAQTPSFGKLFIPRTNDLVYRWVLCVFCTKCTLHSNHRVTRVIFQHTKRLLPRSGHFLTTYTRIA